MLDLRAFAQPDESALQLYARNYVEPVPTGIFFWEAVLPGHVLEVAGRSGCGKTNLLLQASPSMLSVDGIHSVPVTKLQMCLDQRLDCEYGNLTINQNHLIVLCHHHDTDA